MQASTLIFSLDLLYTLLFIRHLHVKTKFERPGFRLANANCSREEVQLPC